MYFCIYEAKRMKEICIQTTYTTQENAIVTSTCVCCKITRNELNPQCRNHRHYSTSRKTDAAFCNKFCKHGAIITIFSTLPFSDKPQNAEQNLPPRRKYVVTLPCEIWIFNYINLFLHFVIQITMTFTQTNLLTHNKHMYTFNSIQTVAVFKSTSTLANCAIRCYHL